MRTTVLKLFPFMALVLLMTLALWLWVYGGATDLSRWAAEGQRQAQGTMAGALRRLKAGDPLALATLLGLCFAYGVFHAAGPGHGKLLIGGYGVARRVPVLRLSVLAVASSLAQAASAVLLVGAGVWVFHLSRDVMVDSADRLLAPASYGAIALVGLWLVWRGIRALRRRGADSIDSHNHSHDTATCGCGHAHGPTAAQAAELHSLREALMLILSIAIRPCTGALFVLIITWRMGLLWAGVASAFVMGLGTASVTVAVALLSVLARESVLARQAPSRFPWLAPALQIAAGAMVALVAMHLLRTSL